MRFRKSFALLFSALFVLSFAACSDDDESAEATPTPTAAPTTAPTPVALTFSQVSAGGNHHYQGVEDNSAHTCGISTDGSLWCWGNNGFGQLGTGDYASTSVPVQVGTETDWLTVESGGARTCGIRGTGGKGTLWCWGSNLKYSSVGSGDRLSGLLGLGNTYDAVASVASPTQIGAASDWRQLGLANHHACGIRDSGTVQSLWCWGSDSNGALGDGNSGSNDGTNEPAQEIGDYTDWAYVAGSKMGEESNETCGIRDDGAGNTTIWCMGYGENGIPGGDSPSILGAATDWIKIAIAGGQAYCAINNAGGAGSGELYCASDEGSHGQAGQGDYSSYSLTQVGSDTTWTDVSIGRQSVCGINDGALYCWGRDHVGELGVGPSPSHPQCSDYDGHGYAGSWDCNEPVKVDDTNTWVSASVGRSQACGLTDADELYCWGQNIYGAVGVNDGPIVYFPTKVE